MRSFIGIKFSTFTVKQIHRVKNDLTDAFENYFKFVPDENIHLTLKFLETGVFEYHDLEKLFNKIKDKLTEFKYLDIKSSKVSFGFHDGEMPHVLILSIENNSKLNSLYDFITEEISNLGYELKNNRDFTAHVTIGKVKNGLTIEDHEFIHEYLKKYKSNLKLEVESIDIIESRNEVEGKYKSLFNVKF